MRLLLRGGHVADLRVLGSDGSGLRRTTAALGAVAQNVVPASCSLPVVPGWQDATACSRGRRLAIIATGPRLGRARPVDAAGAP